jgi:hypothetical protein
MKTPIPIINKRKQKWEESHDNFNVGKTAYLRSEYKNKKHDIIIRLYCMDIHADYQWNIHLYKDYKEFYSTNGGTEITHGKHKCHYWRFLYEIKRMVENGFKEEPDKSLLTHEVYEAYHNIH